MKIIIIKKYHTAGTAPKSSGKIANIGKFDNHSTQINDRSLSCQ
jgi:hypothetical protein